MLLAIEVADSSLDYDRDVKTALYARHGIAEVWLVDIAARRVHRFREIVSDVYRDVTTLDTTDAVRPERLDGTAIDLSTLFPH